MQTYMSTGLSQFKKKANEFLHYIILNTTYLEVNLGSTVWKRTMSPYLVHMWLFQILKYMLFLRCCKIAFLLS